jgi:hypothetical protein
MLRGIKARAKGFGGHIRGGTRPWKAPAAGTTMPEWNPHPGLGNAVL